MRSLRRVLPFLIFVPLAASAQTSISLSPTDRVYEDLVQLRDHGLLSNFVMGQRPYSRRQIAKLIAEAVRTRAHIEIAAHDSSDSSSDSNTESTRTSTVDNVIRRLRSEFADQLSASGDYQAPTGATTFRLFDAAALDYTRSTGSRRQIPDSNGLGSIDASIDPFTANRQGRAFADGDNLSIESSQWLESAHFALSSRARVHGWSTDGRSGVGASLEELHARTVFRNLAIDIGRQYVMWGQGRNVGLLGSNNAPAFDAVKLSNEGLVRLPWILRSLGPTKLSIFYADLGPAQNFRHPYLVGYKVSVLPSNWWELGASVYSKSGGRGSPPASLTARLLDLLPFLEAGVYNNNFGTRGMFTFSDRYAGLDTRVRLAKLHSMELFGELLFNDFDSKRLTSSLTEDAGHVFGATIPRLGRDEAWRVDLELHHTGIRYYLHPQFKSGQSLRGQLLGDPLGPDALGAYGAISWQASETRDFSVDLALEKRSDDKYLGDGLPNGSMYFYRVLARPKELRARAVLNWRRNPSRGGFGLISQLGYERIRNFNFQEGMYRNGLLVRVGVDYRRR